jgi:DNA primase
MDVIALHRAGIDEADAPNVTAVTEAHLERMWLR